MVSQQVLLALGVGLPLLAIGTYAAWLGRRVATLESRHDEDPSPEDPGDREGSGD